MIVERRPAVRVQPFDEFGRRIFTMPHRQGPFDVVQGITELTPEWAKVEGISHVWDMRIATSSIPCDTLHKILLKQIDPKNIEHYKKIARFYIQKRALQGGPASPGRPLEGVSRPGRREGAIAAVAAGDRAAFGAAAGPGA